MISPNMVVTKRRLACPQTVQHLWDAITFIRQQKQIPNLDRISAYMKRSHNLSAADVERQLNYAVRDGLIIVKKSVGSKGSKVGVEQEGYRIPEEMPKKDDHDWYCFECHRGGEVVLCSSCHRVYHSFCMKEEVSSGSKFVCSICKMIKGTSQFKMKKENLNTLLGYTCLRLKEKTKELHRMPHAYEDKWRHDYLLYEKMDLIVMEDKTKQNEFRKLEEFQADAQNIVHNVVIFFGVHSGMADLARQMLRDCVYDLGEIRQCKDCYRMSNEKTDKYWFCQPCDPPHELVYAKQKGFPYWPAKVIRRANDKVDVRFFGGYHQRANVEKENTKPISTSLQQMSLKRTTALNKALEELRHHQQLTQQLEKRKASNAKLQSQSTSSSSSKKRSYQRRTRKASGSSEVTDEKKTEDVSDFEADTRDLSDEESPSSSSPKVARLNDTPLSEDHNVVSSSSQETPITKVNVATQTHKKLLGSNGKATDGDSSNECNCSVKYSKVFRDFRERLESEHKEDKERSLKELTERLQKEFEEEKQKAVSSAMDKLHREMEQARHKTEEQLHTAHQQQARKMIEQHQQEISETKKKQWCYNCEAEAIYHCCWNTSYCSVECQQVHWHKEHKRTCRRKR